MLLVLRWRVLWSHFISWSVSLSFGEKSAGDGMQDLSANLRFWFRIDFAKTLQWTHRRQAGLAFRVILSFNKVIMYFKPDQFRIKRPNERATEAVCTRAGKSAPVYEQFPNPAFLSYILLFFSCILKPLGTFYSSYYFWHTFSWRQQAKIYLDPWDCWKILRRARVLSRPRF